MPDLRKKVEAATERWFNDRECTGVLDLSLAVAALVLTDYAERMERAGQPAAALGAALLAETLK